MCTREISNSQLPHLAVLCPFIRRWTPLPILNFKFKKVSFVIRCFERFSSYANSNYKDWAESLFLAVNFGPCCDSVFYKNLFLDLYNAPDMKSLNGLNVQLGIFFLLCSGNKNSGDCQYPLLFYIEPSSGGIYFNNIVNINIFVPK